MKRFLLFALAVIVFAACSKDAINEQQNVQTIVDEAPATLVVGFEEGDDTRIQLNEAQKTVWTKGDLVSVFYKSDANQKYEYRGETGERTAELHKVSAGSSTTKMGYVVVAYPYNEEYIISPASGNLETMLPAVQHYAVDSYGVGDNLMVSCSEFTQFSLKSVCGWLKLQLTGNGEKVKSITLRGNNGEQVAGLIHVDTKSAEATLYSEQVAPDDNGNANGSLVVDGAMVTELTLDCGEGVTLGKNATAFYIALPPQTFENGLTIEIEDTDALKMTKSTDKAVIIERNTIQPMTSFEVDVKPVLSDYYITTEFDIDTPGTELYYVNELSKMVNEGNTLVNIDYGDGSFGKTVPHTYEAAGRYTVKFYFESPITEIADYAFHYSDVRSVVIPASVTQLGYMSFNSSSLEGITYEKNSSLKIIEGMAFANCRNLESFSIPSSVESIGECVLGGCTSLKDIKNSSSKYICGYLDDAIILHERSSVFKIIAYTAGQTTEDLSCVYLSVDIGWGAFVQCPYIKTVDLVNITNIEQVNFTYCNNLESINLNKTAHIANNVLSYCDKLEAIDAPDAAFIGEDTFCNNKSMAYIKLGSDKLTTISRVGNNNESLQTVHIPSGVESIANSFNGNAMLAEVYCKATTPPALTDSFDSIPENATLYVPVESVGVYKSAEGWNEFAIVGYDFENGEIVEVQPNNQIWYTSSDGDVVTPYRTNVFGATIISNEYNKGKGVITFDGDVTTIGYAAFTYCYSLTSVNIPDSVTEIGEGAFWNCTSLTSVTIPDSVTTIGNYAFENCYSLTSVTIGDSVTTIGNSAFHDCTSLKEFKGKFAAEDGRSLIMDNTIIAYAKASGTTYTIPDSVTTIGNYAFNDCDSLTSVHIPDSVTNIGELSFEDCDSLTSVNIPDSVTTIGYEAFYSCDSLTSVNIPDSVTTIGYNAFAYCTRLTSVTIGDSVTTIGNYTFSHCRSLTSVNIPDSVTTIGYEAFCDCTSLTSVNIPDSVKTIGNYAFYNCRSLTSVNIPDSVTTIGASAFYACTSLTSVNIPDSVTTIGGSAFEDCDSLTSVTIGDSVTTIGYSTFYSCDSLKKVYCYATIPPALGGTSVFDANGSGRKIYVPAGSMNAYKSADGWNEYADAIVGYDFENGVVVE